MAFLDCFTTLGDLARIRLLRLLEREELSVGEMARAVQLPQSTVSRHLKHLHEAGWVAKRASGTASLYRLSLDAIDDGARSLWQLTVAELGQSATFDGDEARLAAVLEQRRLDSGTFFGRVAGTWDDLRTDLFGNEFTASALLGLVDPDAVVADLGCGTGNAAVMLAPAVARVVAIDREPAMLEAARQRLDGADNVEFHEADLHALPLADGAVDAAVVFLVLHHLESPGDVVREMGRTLRPGGLALVVDMVRHDREDYQHTMGHRHMGFDESQVASWLTGTTLELARYRRLPPNPDASGPGLFAATLRRKTTT